MGEATSGGQEDGVVVGPVVKPTQRDSRGICQQEPVLTIVALIQVPEPLGRDVLVDADRKAIFVYNLFLFFCGAVENH